MSPTAVPGGSGRVLPSLVRSAPGRSAPAANPFQAVLAQAREAFARRALGAPGPGSAAPLAAPPDASAGPSVAPGQQPGGSDGTIGPARAGQPQTAPAAAANPRPTALRLTDYPRPPGDNGRGIHWVPTVVQSREVVDRFVREAKAMKMKWVVFLNEGTKTGDNDYLVKQLVANGIEPIMRIYTPTVGPIPGDLEAMVRHYKALGVDYYQIYNEPNLKVENPDGVPSVSRYLDYWIPAARAVARAGGLPGFGSLAPGGDYDDLQFLREALEGLKARGALDTLDRGWISLHNYTFNHPIEYAQDSNGFLKFRWYDEVARAVLGRSIPIIGTEGGTFVGAHEDKTFPPVDERRQVQMVTDAYRYMRRAEPYYFAYTYWLIANEAGGGLDQGFSRHALFKPDGATPLVEALKRLE